MTIPNIAHKAHGIGVVFALWMAINLHCPNCHKRWNGCFSIGHLITAFQLGATTSSILFVTRTDEN